MRDNIEIKWGVNGFAYLFVNGWLAYKSKNAEKVNARYEQMMRIQENRERRIQRFKDNPYRAWR